MTGLMEHLLATPAWAVLLVVFALPFLESAAFLGFVFPGETAVVLGGVVAGQGRIALAPVIAAAILGAIAGDAIGYVVGRHWGRWMLDSTLGRFIKAHHIDRAEQALVRRGGWAVFLGRFTAALRVMIPGLAGMAGMPYRRFALANAAGGAVWAVSMVLIGYLAGNAWHRIAHDVSLAGIGLVVLLAAALVGGHLWRRRRANVPA
ncbi:DedA family protein [Nocardioides montaniterrae]